MGTSLLDSDSKDLHWVVKTQNIIARPSDLPPKIRAQRYMILAFFGEEEA